MGWSIPWVSSAPGDFNFDLGFSHTPEAGREVVEPDDEGRATADRRAQRASVGTDAAGYMTESPGFSMFALEDGDVYRAYSTTWRGLEFVMSYYPILDQAPRAATRARRGRSGSAGTTSTPSHPFAYSS